MPAPSATFLVLASGVRVLDFGLAHAETAPARPATPVAQHRGLIAEAPADVFSFCVALYEALYRSHPFGPPDERLGRVRSGEHDPPRAIDGVPVHVRNVLERGLARKPADRPSLAGENDAVCRDRDVDPPSSR